MKFLIAPDKFKGSLSAQEVALTIERGVKKVFPKAQTKILPLADGGDGTAAILGETLGAKFYSAKVHGPLGKPVQARFAIKGKTAYLDFASACGLSMLSVAQRNPMKTSSNGVGELMLHAVTKGAIEMVIGVGGSATVDGGIGALTALGMIFLDKSGKEVPLGGRGLRNIYSIYAGGCLLPRKTKILILSDVQNTLLGKRGAAAVFGPQKGATPAMVKQLDQGLSKLNQAIVREGAKSVETIPAGGAAGGIVAGFSGVLGGLVGVQVKAISGIDYVMKALEIEKYVKWCDCVITGEGKLDRQTLDGKTVGGIARLGRKYRKPVLAATGRLDIRESELNRLGLSMAWSIAQSSVPVTECIRNARPWLEKSTSRALLEAMASS
jgi:glycerate 2-kinase